MARLVPRIGLVASGLVAVAALHCGVDAEGVGDVVDSGAGVDAGEASPPSPPSPFGLDTRPANTTCRAPKRPPPRAALGVKLERVFANVPAVSPTVLTKRRGVPRWYVAERGGRVFAFDDAPAAATTTAVLDLSAKVSAEYPEGGLLGFTLDPDFTAHPFAYAYYSDHEGFWGFGARLARFRSNDGGLTFDPASEEVLLELPRNIVNHLGGNVTFGPDGYLYVGIGDGGVPDAAQQLDQACDETQCTVLSGKILRLDVHGAAPYAIPSTNPFAGGGGRKEIFAWGFRNPWRWSFDRSTGALWVADVGEETWEEIDIVERAGNYGWPLAEGFHCAAAGTCRESVEPIYEVPHPEAQSLTGGFVYRGQKIPRLFGTYLFADFVQGKLWALVTDPSTGERSKVTLNADGPPVYAATYAETDDGEVLVVDYQSSPDGKIVVHAFVPDGSVPTTSDTLPTRLSESGCFDTSGAPLPATIPYGVNVPFWSDGAEKDRRLAIPDGTTIGVRDDGDLDLPIGAVTIKTFRIDGKPVETRLFVRHDDGEWAGYSYEWNEQGTDASLLADGKTKTVGGGTWVFPSRAECMRCHTAAAGRTLGLELRQIDRVFDYPGRPARDQLDTWNHLALLASPAPHGGALPVVDGTAPVAERARAYLHANCSYCHRPGATAALAMDLRFGTPPSAAAVCDVPPQRGSMGIVDARLLAPGDPQRSLVVRRPRSVDVWRMPPLASTIVDDGGTAVVAQWIADQKACP